MTEYSSECCVCMAQTVAAAEKEYQDLRRIVSDMRLQAIMALAHEATLHSYLEAAHASNPHAHGEAKVKASHEAVKVWHIAQKAQKELGERWMEHEDMKSYVGLREQATVALAR